MQLSSPPSGTAQRSARRSRPARSSIEIGSSIARTPSSISASPARTYEGAIGASATIAFAAAFAATAGQPAEITNFLDLEDDLVVAAPEIRDGRATVLAAPGLGVAVDEERLQRYRVDR